MKRALFLFLILIPLLLAGCGREAREPVPDWPDRITGEYDDTLAFTYRGTKPVSAGVDSLTGRMTALFSPEDGGTLALGWRHVAGAEAELLEDFLADGGIAGIWSEDPSSPGAAEAYASLGGRWYCLSASCPGKDRNELLALLDGTVSAQAGEDRVWPRLTGEPWLAELPWEEDWACLILGDHELEPETGKEDLRALFSVYSWVLAEPGAEEAEPVPGQSFSVVPRVRETQIWTSSGSLLRFHLRRSGEVWWNGALWRPAGEGAGEALLSRFEALRDYSGIPVEGPPPMTYSCGEETLSAWISPNYSWNYLSRAGVRYGAESDGDSFENIDWLDGTRPVLRAEGVVRLSFPTREPDRMTLYAFTGLDKVPVELRDGGFVPYAGSNAYCLSVFWEKTELGGYGGATYILLIDGACASDLPESDGAVSVTLLGADAWGCSFTLENRDRLNFRLGMNQPIFRRTDSGGWEWMKPLRYADEDDRSLPGAGAVTTLGLDWSRTVGTLEAGEYALLLSGRYQDRKGRDTGDPVYLPLRFTLGEDALPEPPGPLSVQAAPEGFSTEMTQRTPHRWTQTVSAETGEFIPDRDFFLFRRETDGSLTYLPAAYRLSTSFNFPLRVSGSTTLEVNLAARYGGLEAGTYVLRRRIYRLEEGEGYWTIPQPFDWSWRTQPEERIRYVDVQFTLTRYLPPASREAEPAATVYSFYSVLYTGEEAELPVSVRNGQFTAGGCRFAIRNPGEQLMFLDPDEASLYYLESNGEWLPLALQRHFSYGLNGFPVPPGESRECRITFGPGQKYAALPGGTYRLVFSAYLGNDGNTRYPVAVEFRIREDGTGMYTGLYREAEAEIDACSRRLAAARTLPDAVIDRFAAQGTDAASHRETDPYLDRWDVRLRNGRLLVTVHRDRDAARAKELLADLDFVDVVRGKDAELKSSPLGEGNAGDRAELRAELLEQTDPELYRQGTWLLSFRWTGEDTRLDSNACLGIYPEVLDPEMGKWKTIPLWDGKQYAVGFGRVDFSYPVLLRQGAEYALTVICLGRFDHEFVPGEEYRFLVGIDGSSDPGDQLEFYTCPFSVAEAGQA